MEQGRCSLTPRTQRRSQNIVLTLQRYIIIWLLPNKIVLFYFSSPLNGSFSHRRSRLPEQEDQLSCHKRDQETYS